MTAHVEAAGLLWDAWTSGTRIVALPETVSSREQAYAIQDHLDRRGADRVGWKIAATSVNGQRHIGVDGPLIGRLLATMLVPPGSNVSLHNNSMRVAEPEFAFRFAGDMPGQGPCSTAEALDAVASLHPAIEIPDSRFVDYTAVGAHQLIADNACGHRVVIGPASPETWRTLDLTAQAVTAEVRGRYRRAGTGEAVLGGPLNALAWAVGELRSIGQPPRQGDVIITGTCMQPLDVLPGDVIHVDYGVVGTLTLSFTE